MSGLPRSRNPAPLPAGETLPAPRSCGTVRASAHGRLTDCRPPVTLAGVTRRTLIIGIATLLAVAVMAVVFVTSATAAATVQTAPVIESQSAKAAYDLGADCPFGGH